MNFLKLILEKNVFKALTAIVVLLFISFKALAASEFSISKNDYLKQFGSEFVVEFCSEDQFLKCFKTSKANCIDSSKEEFNLCVKALSFPDKFDFVDFASSYEKDLGECVGSNMAKKFRLDFKNSIICQAKVTN